MRLSSGRAASRLARAIDVAIVRPCVLDDLAFELLATDRRVGIAALHLGAESRRQVGGVVGGARASW